MRVAATLRSTLLFALLLELWCAVNAAVQRQRAAYSKWLFQKIYRERRESVKKSLAQVLLRSMESACCVQLLKRCTVRTVLISLTAATQSEYRYLLFVFANLQLLLD